MILDHEMYLSKVETFQIHWKQLTFCLTVKDFYELKLPRIQTRNTHGTGCTLASCLASELAKGSSVLTAVKVAKRYVESVLDYSKDITVGKGCQGPFDHFCNLKNNVCGGHGRHTFDPNDPFMYAVTDSRMNKKWGRSIPDVVRAVIEGGASIVQIREKDTDTRDFSESAKACLKICHSLGVPLLINDPVDIALACDADGVHVGQSDMPARAVRSLLGPEKIVGISCNIGCGGVYPTNTKEDNLTVGLDGLRAVCLSSKLPIVAIGGIGTSNASSVMEMGVPNLRGVAVASALFDGLF